MFNFEKIVKNWLTCNVDSLLYIDLGFLLIESRDTSTIFNINPPDVHTVCSPSVFLYSRGALAQRRKDYSKSILFWAKESQ